MQQVKGSAALLGGQAGEQAVLTQQVAHQPAAVATRRAKAGGLRFDDRDLQLGGLAFQVVSGPQPGVTGADNGHVDVQVMLQGRPRVQRVVQLVYP